MNYVVHFTVFEAKKSQMNILKKILICCIILTSNLAFGVSNGRIDIAKIPLDQCTIKKVIGALSVNSMDRTVEISKNNLATLHELNSIVRLTKKPYGSKLKIKDLLSSDELDKFNEASQRQQILTKEELIEGDRGRDLDVISKLVNLVKYISINKKFPTANYKQNYILFGFLSLGHKEFNIKDLLPHNYNQAVECNLDYALSGLESGSIKKASDLKPAWDRASLKISEIFSRYSLADRKSNNFNDSDKAEL
jgi:hypothetical protein